MSCLISMENSMANDKDNITTEKTDEKLDTPLGEEIKKSKKMNDVDYVVGKAYHVNYRLSDAIKSFELYIDNVSNKPKEDDKQNME